MKRVCECKDCTERHVGCHATCEKYKAFREDLLEHKRKEYKERLVNMQLYEMSHERCQSVKNHSIRGKKN